MLVMTSLCFPFLLPLPQLGIAATCIIVATAWAITDTIFCFVSVVSADIACLVPYVVERKSKERT